MSKIKMVLTFFILVACLPFTVMAGEDYLYKKNDLQRAQEKAREHFQEWNISKMRIDVDENELVIYTAKEEWTEAQKAHIKAILEIENIKFIFQEAFPFRSLTILFKPNMLSERSNVAVGMSFSELDEYCELDYNDAMPILDSSGRVQLPLRLVAVILNAKLSWEDTTKKAELFSSEHQIEFFRDQDYLVANGKVIQTEITMQENKIYIPIRSVAEAIGGTVTWDDKYATAYLNWQYSM